LYWRDVVVWLVALLTITRKVVTVRKKGWADTQVARELVGKVMLQVPQVTVLVEGET
jgi:hypothetical protein